MDWSQVGFNWTQARAFLVTAEEGSLSAAARALGLTQPTLSRQVDALEEQLEVALFERVGRGLALTASGHALLPYARAMGDAAHGLSLAAAGQSGELEGTVTIGAGEAIAAYLLPPVLRSVLGRTSGLKLEVVATAQTSDLIRREVDIAVRNFRPEEEDLIAKKIREAPVRLYATPTYVESLGNPRAPADLAGAQVIGFDAGDGLQQALNGLGFAFTKANFRLASTNHMVGWAYVRAGLGIGVMMEDVGDRSEDLVRVVDGSYTPLHIPLWLTAHRELVKSRRVRVVFDLLEQALR